MKQFSITVEAAIPYPFSKTYRVDATAFPAAISRGVKAFRKDVGRKKIDKIKVTGVVAGNHIEAPAE